jgi:hypothetical protein
LIFKAEGKNVEISYTEGKGEEQGYHKGEKIGLEARG